MTKQELTTEIMENDELFHRWLYGELYDALKEAGFFEQLEKEMKEMKEWEQIVLYGTGEGEPVGILSGTTLVKKASRND
jgi:hypothetical protein